MQSPLALHSLEDDGIAKFYGMQSVAQLNTYEAIHLCNWRPAAARALRVQGESTRQTRSHGVISWSPPPSPTPYILGREGKRAAFPSLSISRFCQPFAAQLGGGLG